MRINNIIVSFFGVGYIKPASATWGSLAAGILLYFFWPGLSTNIKLLVILLVFVVGVILSTKIEEQEKIHDPHFIVIDEVVGMMISSFLLGYVWWHWITVFLLFRFFDIAKFWPASFFDNKKGGFSIMIDDVLMAVPVIIISYFLF